MAVIAFIPNDPTPTEVSRVPTVDNNPSELERHVFVTRDGSMVWGKLYKFSPDGNIITFDQREGGRHDVAASNMSRIYINPAAARVVYAPILQALPTNAAAGANTAVATSGCHNNGARQSAVDADRLQRSPLRSDPLQRERRSDVVARRRRPRVAGRRGEPEKVRKAAGWQRVRRSAGGARRQRRRRSLSATRVR